MSRANTSTKRPSTNTRPADKPATERRYNTGGIFAGLIFVLILLYIGGYVYTYVTREKLVEVKLVYGIADRPAVIDAVVIFEENVYQANKDGYLLFSVPHGGRVAKNGNVCSVFDAAEVEQIESKLADVNNTILNYQENRDAFSNDINNINARIKKLADENVFYFSGASITGIYSFKEKVQNNLDLRNQILLGDTGAGLTGYFSEKALYEKQLDGLIDYIRADRAGLVSYYVDGTEPLFTENPLDSPPLPKEYVQAKLDYSLLHTAKEVESGQPAFKVVTSNMWYIAAYIPRMMTKDWEIGDTVTLYIEDGDEYKPLDMKLSRMTDVDDSCYVVFSNDRYLLNFLDTRYLSFKLSQDMKQGLQIPVSAIAEKTVFRLPKNYIYEEMGLSTINKLTPQGVVKTAISVSFTDRDYDYTIMEFNKLELGDVLINPENTGETITLDEVINVKGVFVTNSGTAVFKRINLEGAIDTGGEYLIIDPSANPGLKIHDRIASDASHVADKQLVY